MSFRDVIIYSWQVWDEIDVSTIKACSNASIIFNISAIENIKSILSSADVNELNILISKINLNESIEIANSVDVDVEKIALGAIDFRIILELIKFKKII